MSDYAILKGNFPLLFFYFLLEKNNGQGGLL